MTVEAAGQRVHLRGDSQCCRSWSTKPFAHGTSDLRHIMHQSALSQSLLLIDPSTQTIDYGAGVLDAKTVRKLRDIQRNGLGLGVWANRRKTVGNWVSEHDHAATFSFFAGLVGMGLASTFVPLASAGSFFMVEAGIALGVVLTVIGASRFVVPRANRRIDALHQMLKAVAVELPTYTGSHHGDDPEANRIGELRERLAIKLCDLREKWLEVRKSRKVSRVAKAEMAAEMDLVLYAIARAANEPTPELGKAVIARTEALMVKFEQILAPPPALPLAIEAPVQIRDADQLIRDLTGDAEPEHVELDYAPVTSYVQPPAKEI